MDDETRAAGDVRWNAENAVLRWENEGGAVMYKPWEYPDPGESAFDASL